MLIIVFSDVLQLISVATLMAVARAGYLGDPGPGPLAHAYAPFLAGHAYPGFRYAAAAPAPAPPPPKPSFPIYKPAPAPIAYSAPLVHAPKAYAPAYPDAYPKYNFDYSVHDGLVSLHLIPTTIGRWYKNITG